MQMSSKMLQKLSFFWNKKNPNTQSLDSMSILLPNLSWYLILINIFKKNNHMNYTFRSIWKTLLHCNLTTVWTPKRRCWLVVCCFCCCSEWWDTYLGLCVCVQSAIIYFQASFHQKVAENATRWLLNNRNDLYM